MEKVYWTILWIILFAGIIYVNSAEQQQQHQLKPDGKGML